MKLLPPRRVKQAPAAHTNCDPVKCSDWRYFYILELLAAYHSWCCRAIVPMFCPHAVLSPEGDVRGNREGPAGWLAADDIRHRALLRSLCSKWYYQEASGRRRAVEPGHNTPARALHGCCPRNDRHSELPRQLQVCSSCTTVSQSRKHSILHNTPCLPASCFWFCRAQLVTIVTVHVSRRFCCT